MMGAIVILLAIAALFAAAFILMAKPPRPLPRDTGFSGDSVHVLIGLYGLLLEELKVFTDVDLAVKEANELVESYGCKKEKDTQGDVGFFATNSQGDNEVHLRCNVEVTEAS